MQISDGACTSRDCTSRVMISSCPQAAKLMSPIVALQAMRKLHSHLRAGKMAAVEQTLPQPSSAPSLQPHSRGVDEDLNDAARVSFLFHVRAYCRS